MASTSATEKALDCFKCAFEKAMNLLGPVFVALGITLLAFVVYTHTTAFLPFYNRGQIVSESIPSIMHLICTIWLSCNILYNYLMAVFKNPGTAPAEIDDANADSYLVHPDVSVDVDTPASSAPIIRHCRSCGKPKCERSHHCHVCGRCVLKMDHHCPWIANCVGHGNHIYFLMFLLYMWLGSGYAAIMGFKPLLVASNFEEIWESRASRSSVIFAGVLTIAIFVAMSILFFWQTYLMLTAQTSIEFYINQSRTRSMKRRGLVYKNPYDLGIRRNFQQFFGMDSNRWWFMWLLPGGPRQVGNGILWKTRSDVSNGVLQNSRAAAAAMNV